MMAAVIVSGVGLVAHPAGATTQQQLQTAITRLRGDVFTLNEYANGRQKFLERTTCENLKRHSVALGNLSRPDGVPRSFWRPTMVVAREYEAAAESCLDLDQDAFNAHLQSAFAAVKQAQAHDPTKRRFK